jgi:hypothetical protein
MVILGVIYGSKGPVDEAKIENGFKIILLFAVLPSAISFYGFYYFVFPEYLKHKSILRPVIFAILISLGSAIIGYNILVQVMGPDCFEDGGEDASEVGIVIFISFIALVCGIIALIIRGFITWFEEIKLKDELKQKNLETEMALVKAQLDPHFLFNTLNNIDVLILKDPTDASNYLNKLSDIMRFMLFETKTDLIPLSKEIEYIEKYIDLQKIRTSNKNYVNFSVIGKSEGKTIAPMVFIPFIENAFKHTTNKKTDDAINIRIWIENSSVKMVCENKFSVNAKVKPESNGLGNKLIQKRLDLIYPDNHILEVANHNNLYSVSLTIFHA